MKTLILIRGVSGSGKTTFAQLVGGPNCVLESTDNYFLDDEGVYRFDPKDLAKNHQLCQRSVEQHMECGQEFISVANTFTKEWELQPYLALAEKYGYRVHSIIVENRHGGDSIHDVPSAVIEAQKARFEVEL